MHPWQARLPHLLRQFPELGPERIEAAADADPSRGKGYLTWILRMVRKGGVRLPEDACVLAL